jgi:hypothetical protein
MRCIQRKNWHRTTGLVQIWAAIVMGILSGSIPWYTMMVLHKKWSFRQRIDDTLVSSTPVLWLAQPSSWVASFLLTYDSPRVEERCFSPMVIQLLQLTRSISPVYDQYVQYLLVGANPSVLNQHSRGATTLEVPVCHIPLFDLSNQLSPLFT